MSSTTYFSGAAGIECKQISTIHYGQDGAIFADLIFRMETNGICYVHDLKTMQAVGEFPLDKRELICPHSNAVCFGPDYYEEGDEFPLFYANVYNNYQRAEERHEGTLCVYRITRDGAGFASKLVQVIRVGFVKTPLWCSQDRPDVRPYGNFVIDADSRELVAFTMRDQERRTRFFRFPLPDVRAGRLDEHYGVNELVLAEADIITHFDIDYMLFMQGATCHKGYVYSSEGFSNETEPPRIRIIDLKAEKQVLSIDLRDLGLTREAELVEVYEGKTYYSDNHGILYAVTFR